MLFHSESNVLLVIQKICFKKDIFYPFNYNQRREIENISFAAYVSSKWYHAPPTNASEVWNLFQKVYEQEDFEKLRLAFQAFITYELKYHNWQKICPKSTFFLATNILTFEKVVQEQKYASFEFDIRRITKSRIPEQCRTRQMGIHYSFFMFCCSFCFPQNICLKRGFQEYITKRKELVNIKFGSEQHTFLHLAAEQKKFKKFKLLLKIENIDIQIKNGAGKTARQIAEEMYFSLKIAVFFL